MKQLFDYIFYRIYAFFKAKNDNAPETKGSLILSLIQFFTILTVMTFVQLAHSFSNPPKYMALVVLLLLGVTNWFIYERNFDEEKYEHWENEDKQKRTRRGWYIVLYLFGSFFLPVLSGILKYNIELI